MQKKKSAIRDGFTLVELIITIVMSLLLILSVGIVLIDNQRGWTAMYGRVYSDVVTDGYFARKMFDILIRKSSREKLLIDNAGTWVEIYYYDDADSVAVDRYARFFYQPNDADGSTGQLDIEYGIVSSDGVKETLTTETISKNVFSCVFITSGQSVQMILALGDGSQAITVTSSAVVHNQ